MERKYRAIIAFTDVADGRRIGYRYGDDYPKSGGEPNEERMQYLLSDKTTFGHPVIVAVPADEAGGSAQPETGDNALLGKGEPDLQESSDGSASSEGTLLLTSSGVERPDDSEPLIAADIAGVDAHEESEKNGVKPKIPNKNKR